MNVKSNFYDTIQGVFAEKIADDKIKTTLVKAKSVQIPVFHGMADLHICDKVRSIIKAKIVDENNVQDEEKLLPGN